MNAASWALLLVVVLALSAAVRFAISHGGCAGCQGCCSSCSNCSRTRRRQDV